MAATNLMCPLSQLTGEHFVVLLKLLPRHHVDVRGDFRPKHVAGVKEIVPWPGDSSASPTEYSMNLGPAWQPKQQTPEKKH